MFFFLVYVSSTNRFFSRAQLEEILRTSRRNNEEAGISGLLLYKDGNVMQVLEGDEQKVRGLYDHIGSDFRHSGLILLLDGFEEERQFPSWSMAFHDLEAAETLAEVPGYSPYLNTPLTAAEFAGNPSRCELLLKAFRQTV